MLERKLTFSDALMLFVSIPLILGWIFFACYIIYSGIERLEGQMKLADAKVLHNLAMSKLHHQHEIDMDAFKITSNKPGKKKE